jgi:uncharacterized protein YgiM (DUF1202 family)
MRYFLSAVLVSSLFVSSQASDTLTPMPIAPVAEVASPKALDQPNQVLALEAQEEALFASMFPRPGVVTTSVLNVRARPGTRYEVICKLRKKDKVTIVSAREAWYEITVPEEASAWIASRFVDSAGRILADRVRVRAGAGLAFTPYGYVNEDDEVTLKGPARYGWQQIQVPQDATAWVGRDFIKVKPVPKPVPKLIVEDEKAEEDAELAAADTPAAAETAPELAEQDSKPAEASAIPVTADPEPSVNDALLTPATPPAGTTALATRTGLVIPLGKVTAVATHALVRRVEGATIPVCYLYSTGLELKEWEMQDVQVYGTETWIKSWKRPIIEITGIQLSNP